MLYHEALRPQFHYTAREGWLNDPNGLVYFAEEYHLFFQHNPKASTWGNMTWGHAVSTDLVHWQQLPNAIEPDALGTIFSGSAVVDWENTAGFQTGTEPALVAMYTAAGGSSPESEGQPFTQCLAFSNDRGRTWTKYAGNPVLPHIVGENRDPKVIWYAPDAVWVMALFLDGHNFALFTSPDLKEWERIQTLAIPGSSECPDFFPMPVEGETGEERWVLTGANGMYLVGTFDGVEFVPESEPLTLEFGGNHYAVQTFSDIPASDGRRIQLAWMAGGVFPGMAFNQQMDFPSVLTLHREPEGLRLRRNPVREIESIYVNENSRNFGYVGPGRNVLAEAKGDIFDLDMEVDCGAASAFGIRVRGEEIRYEVASRTLSCHGHSAVRTAGEDVVGLRVLIDRTSLEIFVDGGRQCLAFCLPMAGESGLEFFVEGAAVDLVSVRVRELKAVWGKGNRDV